MSLIGRAARRLLERALAAAFELDPESRSALAELEETLLVFELDPPGIATLVRVHRGEIEIGTGDAILPDVTVRGPAPAMLRYLAGWFPGGAAAEAGVSIEGDRARLARLAALCRGLDPDWEEPVARVLGDVPARHLGQLARAARGWAQEARSRVGDAAGEYLQYESAAVPSRREWREHVRDLARLEERLEAAESRLDVQQAGSGGEDRC